MTVAEPAKVCRVNPGYGSDSASAYSWIRGIGIGMPVTVACTAINVMAYGRRKNKAGYLRTQIPCLIFLFLWNDFFILNSKDFTYCIIPDPVNERQQ